MERCSIQKKVVHKNIPNLYKITTSIWNLLVLNLLNAIAACITYLPACKRLTTLDDHSDPIIEELTTLCDLNQISYGTDWWHLANDKSNIISKSWMTRRRCHSVGGGRACVTRTCSTVVSTLSWRCRMVKVKWMMTLALPETIPDVMKPFMPRMWRRQVQ